MPIIRHLIVDEFGTFIRKHSGRLQVERLKTGEKLTQAPLIHLEQVLIGSNGVSISADAVRACAEAGIPIHFMSSRGTPYASLVSVGLVGTVQTRRSQMLAYHDARGLHLARAFATGKIENQARLIRYAAKYRKEKDPDLYQELQLLASETLDHLAEVEQAQGSRVDDVRFQLLSAEGRAAQKYWAAIRLLLRDQMDWPGRRGRGAKDPINMALNYGYGVLYGQVERAILLAGLEPYAGFLHVDRPGKPSLVLDLIEEFRAPVVDRTILSIVNRGMGIETDDQGFLTQETRRMIAERVLDRLDRPERYEGKRHKLGAILQTQARHLATYLRGERETYTPYLASW
ncbi:MAG: CRISPR-associated endonuclease Cas1 [Chloroflexi bacterium]|nr:CRISPR-associated endonuclease Cas1 [Chloroflexota bacterium]